MIPMNRTNIVIFIFFAFFLLVWPAMAYEDTFQYDDYGIFSSRWTHSWSQTHDNGDGCDTVTYGSSMQESGTTDKTLYLRSYVNPNNCDAGDGPSATVHGYATMDFGVSTTYWGMRIDTVYDIPNGVGESFSYNTMLYGKDEYGTTLCSVDIDTYGDGWYELVEQSGNIYLIVDGDNKGLVGTGSVFYLQFYAYTYCYASYGGYGGENMEIDLYVDDITTDNGVTAFCVDHTNDPQNEGTHTWTDSELYSVDDVMYVSWGAETSPASSFTAGELLLGIKELSTGEILNTTVLKPAGTAVNESYASGRVQYNLTTLFGTNYSLYQTYLSLGGTIQDTDYIVWTFDELATATVVVQDEQYVYGQTIYADYNITDMDTTNYNYYMKTISIYGDEVDSKTITTSEGTYSVAVDSDTWDTGFYYVVLQAEDKSSGLISEIAYDVFTLTDSVLLTGTVYDAETGLALANGSVNISQNADWSNTTFDANGTYTISDLSSSLSMTIDAQLSGYNHAPWSFTPLESGQYDVDLYMFDDNISFAGSNSLYGLVVTDTYHQAIENATVYATYNGTTYNTTSTSTGYYYFENLESGNYSVNATAIGYVLLTGAEEVNVTGDTRHDIEMSQRYVLTIRVKDAATDLYITSFTIYVDGDEYDTTTGTVTVSDLEYGQYTITALASGYYGSSRDYLIDEDKTITFSLTEAPSEYYEPHTVELIYMSYFSTRYEGVNVSVYSGHKDDVIVGGVPSEAATLLFSQKTGDTGGVTFELDESTTYTYYAESTDPAFTKISCFAPQDDRYYIFVYNSPFEDVDTPLDQLYYGATGYKENMTTAIIKGAFEDISNSTTLAEWWVNDSNDNQLYYTSTTANNGSFSTYVNVSNNISYTAFFRIDTGALEDTQTIKRTFNFRESVHTAFDLGFTEQWQYHVVSAFIIMLVAGLFSVRDAHMGGIIVVILGWLCIYIGYIEPTITSSLSMSFATLIAGMMYIRRQEM
jgi:hypothetical protein